MRFVQRLIALLGLLGVVLAPTPAQAHEAMQIKTWESKIEPAGCPPFSGIAALEAKCGYLSAPQNHADPNSRPLKLFFMVFKALHPVPGNPDPIFLITGGPGGSSVDLALRTLNGPLQAYLQTHDIVVMDQRGVGRSTPKLECGSTAFTGMDMPISGKSPKDTAASPLALMEACKTDMTQRGLEPKFFNTDQSAHDLNLLREKLLYGRVNVWGISYGTRLALVWARHHPEGIRALMLDGVLPLQINVIERQEAAYADAFQRVFDACAANTACQSAYPDLQKRFAEVVAALAKAPATLPIGSIGQSGKSRASRTLDAADFVHGLYLDLYRKGNAAFIPQTIDAATHKKYANATLLIDATFGNTPHLELGLSFALRCAEEYMPLYPLSESQIQARQANTPAWFKQAFWLGDQPNPEASIFFNGSADATCASWGVEPVSPEFHEPVQSAVPTLLVSGEFDPITPPAYADEAAKTLSNSQSILVKGAGHGALIGGDDCASWIAHQFLRQPMQPVDSDCLADGGLSFQLPPTPSNTKLAAASSGPLRTVACPQDIADLYRPVECGYFSTPIDHNDPTSKAVQLFYLRIKASANTAESDPLLILDGSFQNYASQNLRNFAEVVNTYRLTRDVIALDPRGMGLSEPSLTGNMNCLPKGGPVDASLYLVPLRLAEVQQCRKQLAQAGIDPALFTADQSVADIEALRQALGIPRWNILGISEAARLALWVAKRNPQSTRSVILDGLTPPQTNEALEAGKNLDRWLDQVLKTCAQEFWCNSHHYKLRDTLLRVLDQLSGRAVPVQIEGVSAKTKRDVSVVVMLSSHVYLQTLSLTSGHVFMARMLPAYIESAGETSYTYAAQMAMFASQRMWQDLTPVALTRWCSESIGPATDTELATAWQSTRWASPFLGQQSLTPWRALCQAWGVGALPPDWREAVSGDVPTLLISSQFDLVAPPAYAQLATQTLTHAQVIAVNQTQVTDHTALLTGNRCANISARAFLRHPLEPARVLCNDQPYLNFG